MEPLRVVIVEGSTRFPSSTGAHVDALLAAQRPALDIRRHRLAELGLPPFTDARHQGRWSETGELLHLLDDMLASELIVLASPCYWYTVSHLMKNFLDHWSYYLRNPRVSSLRFLSGRLVLPLIVASEIGGSRLNRAVFGSLRLSASYAGAFCLPGFSGIGGRDGNGDPASLAAVARLDLNGMARRGRTRDVRYTESHVRAPLFPGTVAVTSRALMHAEVGGRIGTYLGATGAEIIVVGDGEFDGLQSDGGTPGAFFFDGYEWLDADGDWIDMHQRRFDRWFGW